MEGGSLSELVGRISEIAHKEMWSHGKKHMRFCDSCHATANKQFALEPKRIRLNLTSFDLSWIQLFQGGWYSPKTFEFTSYLRCYTNFLLFKWSFTKLSLFSKR